MRLATPLAALATLAMSGTALGQPLTIAENTSVRTGWDMASEDPYLGFRAGCFEALMRVDYEGGLEPGLATEYERVEPTVWEFTLREGVTFQDGAPLDAAAVANALTKLLENQVPARPFSPRLIQSVEASDDMTVRITTQEPMSNLPAHLASPSTTILSPAAYEGGQLDPVGTCTGPFEITSVDTAQGMDLVAYPDYWGGEPRLPEARVNFIADPNTRAVQARSGEADISRLVPPATYSQIESSGRAAVEEVLAPRVTMLVMNNERAPLNDVRVRRVIQAAIDTATISQELYEGRTPAANGIFRPTYPFSGAEKAPSYDLEKAKALLAEAGIEPGTLNLEIIAYSLRPEFRDLGAVVQQMLGEIGIGIEIRVAEYNAVEPDLLSGNYDMSFFSRGYLTDVPEPVGFLDSDFGCDGSFNIAQFCSEEVDEKVRQARASEDPAERNRLYGEAADVLHSEAAVVTIVHENTFDALSDRLENARPHPLNYYYLTPDIAVR